MTIQNNITNEIDVSKCKYYEDNFCNSNRTTYAGCKYNTICYYKELQKIKQENKYLKDCAETNASIRLANFYETKIDKITLAYEQKLEKIKNIAKDIIENDCYENSDAKSEKILQIIEGKKYE